MARLYLRLAAVFLACTGSAAWACTFGPSPFQVAPIWPTAERPASPDFRAIIKLVGRGFPRGRGLELLQPDESRLDGTITWFAGDAREWHREGYFVGDSWLVFTPRHPVEPGWPYSFNILDSELLFTQVPLFEVVGNVDEPTSPPERPRILGLRELVSPPNCLRCPAQQDCTSSVYCYAHRYLVAELHGADTTGMLWVAEGTDRLIASNVPSIAVAVGDHAHRVCLVITAFGAAGRASEPSEAACTDLPRIETTTCPQLQGTADAGTATLPPADGGSQPQQPAPSDAGSTAAVPPRGCRLGGHDADAPLTLLVVLAHCLLARRRQGGGLNVSRRG